MPTPSSTATNTATPYATGVLLNEFLANPNNGQEWIEIYNSGDFEHRPGGLEA